MTQEIDLTSDDTNSLGEVVSITLTTEDSETTFDSVEVDDVEFSLESTTESTYTRPNPTDFWFCGSEDDS